MTHWKIVKIPRYRELQAAVEAIEDEMRPFERKLSAARRELEEFISKELKRLKETE